MDIVFTFSLKEHQQQQMKEAFPDVTFHFDRSPEPHLAEADVLVTYGEDLTADHIRRAQKLKWIMVASAGIEKMPHEEIAERGIIVSNVRGLHKIPMAESVLAHILALKRSLPKLYDNQRSRSWERLRGSEELAGSTALIIGPGAIGTEIGRLLQAFRVRTIGCNRSGNEAPHMDRMVSFSSIEEVLPQADIVLSILPSTKETKHMLTAKHFRLMKETAIFMNFGRGDLIDEAVLIDALQSGEVGYAVLDVFHEEPLPDDHPLWTTPNVIISPHASSHSGKYVERALEIFTPNLKRWLEGETQLTNLVDVERGY